VKASDDGYTVTVPVSFEKADANFVYIFDASTGAPTSLTVDVQYSMAETLRRAVMNTIMGIAIVFIVLIFLSFLIYLFRFIPNPEAKKKAQAAAAPAQPLEVINDLRRYCFGDIRKTLDQITNMMTMAEMLRMMNEPSPEDNCEEERQ